MLKLFTRLPTAGSLKSRTLYGAHEVLKIVRFHCGPAPSPPQSSNVPALGSCHSHLRTSAGALSSLSPPLFTWQILLTLQIPAHFPPWESLPFKCPNLLTLRVRDSFLAVTSGCNCMTCLGVPSSLVSVGVWLPREL